MHNEFGDLVKTRRTIRKYLQEKVEDEIILEIFEAVRWAPSAHNSQPWRFVWIKNKKVRKLLIESMAEEYYCDMKHDGLEFTLRMQRINKSKELFLTPPTLILACITMKEMDIYPDERRNKYEEEMAIISLGAALQNLLLMAHAQKIAAGWFCAPLFCQETVKKVLDLPMDFKPQAFITLGYPKEQPNAPRRKNINEILLFR